MSNEELAARIQAGERELMPELWEQVRRFVARMAARRYILSNGYGGVEIEDLIQSGYLALCVAVEGFDPGMGYKFTSYLGNCLKTAFSEAGGYRSKRQYHDPLHGCISLDAPLGDDPDGDTLGDLQPAPWTLMRTRIGGYGWSSCGRLWARPWMIFPRCSGRRCGSASGTARP